MTAPDEPSGDTPFPEATDAPGGLAGDLCAASVVADDQGFVTDIDERFERLFGWTRAEIIGRHIRVIIPRRFRDAHHLGFARFLLTGQPTILGRPLKLYALKKDGSEVSAELVLSADHVNGRWVFRASIRPLAEGGQKEERRPLPELGAVRAAVTAELGSTLGRIELALSLVQDCLVWTDDAGRVLWCNAAFDQLALVPHIDVLGTPLIDWLPLEQNGHAVPVENHPVNLVLKHGAQVFGAYEMAPPAGSPGPIVLEVCGRGRAIRSDRVAVFLLRDMTERARAEEAMRDLNARLAAANSELEAFSYSVSHDLRTPLRAMDGFSQALMEDHAAKLDDEGIDYLRRIRAAAQRMGRLIDDMLSLFRVARAEIHHEPVNLSALARSILEELRTRDPDRHTEFCVQDGLVVWGDERLLRVALENLLDNAWKFTSKVPVARIELGGTKRNGETVVFVRDNGAGFDMEFVDKLFGAFQRLHAESEFPGTGIGLASVRRIIHRHGGRVWAEGSPSGASFYFALPRRESGV